jgi:polyferredoxin
MVTRGNHSLSQNILIDLNQFTNGTARARGDDFILTLLGLLDVMNLQRLRLLSRIFLLLLIILHVYSWYVLDIQVAGSIGIEAFFSGLSRGVINMGFIFWTLVFILTLFLGRAFCGWFCWFGGYLEFVQWGITDKIKITFPRRLLLYLGAIPFVGLALKIYSALLVNWIKKVPTSFTFILADVEPWGGQQTGISILITLFVYGPVLFFIFGSRAWCRYLCPIGALLKIFSTVGLGKIRLTNDDCIGCETCNSTCDMHVDVVGELKNFGEVRNLNCIRCFKCTDNCPQDSISFNFSRGNGVLSSIVADRVEKASLNRRKSSGFDISIAALWIGIIVVMNLIGVRQNAPQELKVLMGPGLLILIYSLVRIIFER